MLDALLQIGPDTLVLAAIAGAAFGLWLGRSWRDMDAPL